MFFSSLNDLLHMAGHGVFVWPAYGLATLIVMALLVLPQRQYRRGLDEASSARARAATDSVKGDR